MWLIPLVALVIALWLAINSWQEKGQEIEILLNAAAGIEVGKTQVRLKDVPVGKVSKMQLTADLSKVRLKVTLEREIAKHLSVNTRFGWSARASVWRGFQPRHLGVRRVHSDGPWRAGRLLHQF